MHKSEGGTLGTDTFKRRFGERGLYQCYWEELAQRGKEPETGRRPFLQGFRRGWLDEGWQGFKGSGHKKVIYVLQESSFRGKGMGEKRDEGVWAHIFKMCIWQGEGDGGSVYNELKRERFHFCQWERIENFYTLIWMEILSWQENSFGCFPKILQKNPNELFGQPDMSGGGWGSC